MDDHMLYHISQVTKDELVDYVKPILKAKGFRKKGFRWTKDEGDFTLCFFIQGSTYGKGNDYVRPGVFINRPIPSPGYAYDGHIMTDIKMVDKQQILADTEVFWSAWIDKQTIRAHVTRYVEWRHYYNGVHEEPSFPWPLPDRVMLSIEYPLDGTWRDYIESFNRALGD